MAQRWRAGLVAVVCPSRLLFRIAGLFPLSGNRARQTEECQPVPTRACDVDRNRAERGKKPVLIAESVLEAFAHDGSPLPLALQQAPGNRFPAMLVLRAPFVLHRFD